MTPVELRRQAAALDRAAERVARARVRGRETSATLARAERELRAADRMIDAARRALRQ